MKYLIFIFLLSFCFFSASPAVSFQENSGLKESGELMGYRADDTVAREAGIAIQVLTGLLGIIFLSMIIYGGNIWMSAMGNEEMVEKGKKTLIAACVGLIIVLSAFIFANFLGGVYNELFT